MPGKRQTRSAKDKPSTPKPVRILAGIRLDGAALAAAPADQRSWVQIARAGRFRGYRSGPIEFTADYFDQLIKNFRSHPSYVAGADGYGTEDIVRYDFDHGSEDGQVDQTVGEPAASWICDLEKRLGANGVVELWALTHFLEPARTYVAQGKYRWTSVAIWPNAIDPVTAKDIGPLLTSVAFTNDPFIQGMAPIAIAASMYFSAASNPEEAVSSLRELLGLPQTTELAVVQAEVGKLKGWLDAGSFPPGVDGDDLIGGMRQILGLPVLTTSDEVFAELAKLVPALADYQKQELAEGASASGNMPSQTAAPTIASNQGKTMDPKDLIILARTYGLNDHAPLDAILMEAKKAMSAQEKLSALVAALGIEDADGAVKKVADMMKRSAELEAAMPELAELKAEKKKAEEKQEEGDVDEAIAAHNLPASMRRSMLLLRRSDKAKFEEDFPKIKASERHLTTQIFSTKDNAQIGSQQTGAGGNGERVLASNAHGTARVMLSNNVGVTLEDVDAADGRNRTEKAMSLVKLHVAGGDKLTFEQLHEAGSKLLSKLRDNG